MNLLFLVALTGAAGIPSDTTLLMRGLVVGTETCTPRGSHLEFHTGFEFVRKVDLTAKVELAGGRIRSLLVSGQGYPWQSKVSPFPVGLLALRASEWEKEGRPSGSIHSCGSRCFVLEDLTWGRSFVWLGDDGSLSSAFVPTPFAPLVALPKGRESEYVSVLEAAARAGLESVSLPSSAGALAIREPTLSM